MDGLIQISKINDFLFCPRSLYLHSVYETYDEETYHDTPQQLGRIAHETVDEKTYSTKQTLLMGMSVYSETYGITGKIDTFDEEKGILTERKKYIKTIFPGHILQVQAEALCLEEMGYKVNTLRIHSMDDNKTYPIASMTAEEKEAFKILLDKITSFDPAEFDYRAVNPAKCDHCIYRPLCH